HGGVTAFETDAEQLAGHVALLDAARRDALQAAGERADRGSVDGVRIGDVRIEALLAAGARCRTGVTARPRALAVALSGVAQRLAHDVFHGLEARRGTAHAGELQLVAITLAARHGTEGQLLDAGFDAGQSDFERHAKTRGRAPAAGRAERAERRLQ